MLTLKDSFKTVKSSERRYPTRSFSAKELLPTQSVDEIEDWDLGEDEDALLSMINKVENELEDKRSTPPTSLKESQILLSQITDGTALDDEDTSRPLESLDLARDVIQAYREKGITHLYEWQVSLSIIVFVLSNSISTNA